MGPPLRDSYNITLISACMGGLPDLLEKQPNPQGGSAPVFLRRILRPRASCGRVWCRVVEFAEEVGIFASFKKLSLGEGWGGWELFCLQQLRAPCCHGRRCGCAPPIQRG
jgi:hypothetical protein